jgi:AcrR family transcriptional regulator
MTIKKQKILQAALELFALEGYKASSTSKVAKKAGVSEGLIFRHFQHKQGLLLAILQEGEAQAKQLFAEIVMETDPRKVIRKTLLMGVKMIQEPQTARFWKLQYKLKWELEQYGAQKMVPLQRALSHAFTALGYDEADKEADFLLIFLDGLAMRYFLDDAFDIEPVLDHLIQKYDV